MQDLERLMIDAREAERQTGFSTKYFEKKRAEGGGPPFTKLPNGKIRYPYPEFKQWVASLLKGAAA